MNHAWRTPRICSWSYTFLNYISLILTIIFFSIIAFYFSCLMRTKLDFLSNLQIPFEDRLNWSYHTEELAKKLSCVTFLIHRRSTLVGSSTLRSIYFTPVHSKMIYGLILWGRYSHVNNIFILPKRSNLNYVESSI